MAAVALATPTTYTAVPLSGLVSREATAFPLYLQTASDAWVLYQPAGTVLDDGQIGRLTAEGVPNLYVRDADLEHYFAHVEAALDQVLHDRSMPIEGRAAVLQGVAIRIADDLLKASPGRETLQRAQKLMIATSNLMLREAGGFAAVRRVLSVDGELSRHCLTVAFLSMGLAKRVLGADGGIVAQAGLAGLLHDVGRIGYEELDHDPEHAERGARYLQQQGLPQAVVEAARHHHESADGSGYPLGLRGEKIPELARIVGLVDRFVNLYTEQRPSVSVFQALRVLAQGYRDCFDSRMARGLVQLFR